MSTRYDEADPSDTSYLPEVSAVEPLPALLNRTDYPELVPVLTQAVDEVLHSSNLDRDRDAQVVAEVERAAAAAAFATYERLAVSAILANDAAAGSRRDLARSVAARAEETAGLVNVAASEVHRIEELLAGRLALVAANAASELAARVGLDDETAASVAAAVVVKAVSEAAAVIAASRASAAINVAQAAADAAAGVAEEAASTALAAEFDVITAAVARRRDALQTCYEAAAAAAQAVITPQPAPEEQFYLYPS